MSKIDEVYNVLNPIAPSQWNIRPSAFPSITFFFFDERGILFADNKEKATSWICQVDVWSKGDYTDIVKQVKLAMETIDYTRVVEEDLYEDDTKIYHKGIRFIKAIEN